MRNCKLLRAGFTLVELVLTLAVLGIVSTILIPLLFTAYDASIVQASVALVEQNGTHILLVMENDIRKAERIVLPTANDDGSVLALQTKSGDLHPLIFGNRDGALIRIHRNVEQQISSPDIAVDRVEFSHISDGDTSQSIMLRLRVSHIIPLLRPRLYERTFERAIDILPDDNPQGNPCGCPQPFCSAVNTLQWRVCSTDVTCSDVLSTSLVCTP